MKETLGSNDRSSSIEAYQFNHPFSLLHLASRAISIRADRTHKEPPFATHRIVLLLLLERIVKEENIGSIRIDFHVLPTKATELSRFEPDSRTRTDYYLVVTLVYRRSRPLSAGLLIRPLHFFCLTSLQTLQQRESYQLLPLQIAGIGFSRIYLKLLLRATPFSTRTRPRTR